MSSALADVQHQQKVCLRAFHNSCFYVYVFILILADKYLKTYF